MFYVNKKKSTIHPKEPKNKTETNVKDLEIRKKLRKKSSTFPMKVSLYDL